jgi:G3E family GTPase
LDAEPSLRIHGDADPAFKRGNECGSIAIDYALFEIVHISFSKRTRTPIASMSSGCLCDCRAGYDYQNLVANIIRARQAEREH